MSARFTISWPRISIFSNPSSSRRAFWISSSDRSLLRISSMLIAEYGLYRVSGLAGIAFLYSCLNIDVFLSSPYISPKISSYWLWIVLITSKISSFKLTFRSASRNYLDSKKIPSASSPQAKMLQRDAYTLGALVAALGITDLSEFAKIWMLGSSEDSKQSIRCCS